MLGVSVLPDLQLHTEAVNKQLDQGLVVDLKVDAFVGDLLDENFQLDSRAVLRVDKLSNGVIEFVRIAIQVDVEVSKLIENELLSLPVLKEKQRNEVFIAEIHQLLCSKT